MKRIALISLFALAGCPSEPTRPATPPDPVVTILTPAPEIKAPGEESVVEYSIRNPDGSIPEGYQLSIVRPDDNWTVTLTTVEPGRERVTMVSREKTGAFSIYAMVRVCVPFKGDPCGVQSGVTAPFAWIIVAGGYSQDVVTPLPELEIRVGEKRPILAFPSTGGAEARFSSMTPTFTTGAPWTATVDEASGEVTGVAPGEATIRVVAGAGAADIKVKVTDGELGPPRHATTLTIPSGDFLFLPSVGLEGMLAMDSRENLMFGATHVPPLRGHAVGHDQSAALLARWTGSGWGLERVSREAEIASEVRVAVDSRDHIWVVYNSDLLKAPVVADRAATDPPGKWRRRLLSPELSTVEAVGQRYFDPQVYMGIGPLDIVPREGGGAWVAFLARAQHVLSSDGDCAFGLKLAEVTDDDVQTSESDLVMLRLPENVPSCPGDYLETSPALQLVPQEGGRPTVLRGERGVPRPSAEWLAQSHDGVPLPGVATVPEAGMFSFEAGRKLYYGDSEAWKLACYSPLGYSFDEPALRAEDAPLANEVRRGWAVKGRWFHQLLSGWAYGSHTLHTTSLELPELPAFDATEEQGAWLTVARHPTLPVVPPLVTADGARLIQTFSATVGPNEISPGYLWRSAGPGQPFAPLLEVAWDTFWPATPMFEGGGRLYAFAADYRLFRSTNGGASWSVYGSISPAGPHFAAAHFFPDGRALAFYVYSYSAGSMSGLQYSADVESGRPFTTKATMPSLQVPEDWAREVAGIYADGDEAWVLNTDGRFNPTKLQVRRVGATGDIESTEEHEVPAFTNPGMGARLGSGVIVMLQAVLHPSLPTPFPLKFVRWDPAGGAPESITPPGPSTYTGCLPPVTLADGRVALVCTRQEALDRTRAVYTTTTDGRSWTEPTVLRPDGGHLQRAVGAAAEKDGGLFVLLADYEAPLVMRIARP